MEQDYRMMSAMVVYSLERSLGDFVADTADIEALPQGMIQTIVQRELAAGRRVSSDAVSDMLEASYMAEIFDFALSCTKDTSLNSHVEYLQNLCTILGLFGIRNLISHPNRPFLENYWYRVAAIASDPIIVALGLEDVLKAFQSAKEGRLTSPPDEWYQEKDWVIPNNLPNTFDHDITGLVGRTKEQREIFEALRNPRLPFIALVAPGGFGKTALALEVMKELSLTPAYRDIVDAIVFVSLKAEKLTSEGLRELDAPSSILEIKKEIAKVLTSICEIDGTGFDSVVKELESQSILLLVDNLETILRDTPTDFLKFNMSLPPNWRVIVTSRITVDSASTISISPLNSSSSIHLAREYAKKRGLQRLDNPTLETIAVQCSCNPLAIRLTLDLYALGKPVPESTGIANEEIAKFSYDNLVDSLSDKSIAILECLFTVESATRSKLMDLLGQNADEIAESIAELTKTSLVHRKSSADEESYSISSSVRDLLLVNPRNIEVRGKISEQLRKQKVFVREQQAVQRQQNLSRFDIRYIPEDAPAGLKILLHSANKIIWRKHPDHRSITDLYQQFESAQAQYDDSAFFHNGFSIILSHLKDQQGCRKHLLKALEINPNEPTTRMYLARLEHKTGDYAAAESIYVTLLSEGLDDPSKSSQKFAQHLVTGYFLGLLFQGKYERVLELTKYWKKEPHFRSLYGAFRAGAWRRQGEQDGKDIQYVQKCMHSAIQILNDVIYEDGYSISTSVEVQRLIKEIRYRLIQEEGVTYYEDYSPEFVEEALNFAAKHLFEIDLTNWSDEQRKSIAEKLSYVAVPNNPFKDGNWTSTEIFIPKSSGNGSEAPAGYILVSIYHVPHTGNAGVSYLFAQDEEGAQYYLNRKQLTHSNAHDWDALGIGNQLWILPGVGESGKAVSAADIRIL